jgi:hypothetical protein
MTERNGGKGEDALALSGTHRRRKWTVVVAGLVGVLALSAGVAAVAAGDLMQPDRTINSENVSPVYLEEPAPGAAAIRSIHRTPDNGFLAAKVNSTEREATVLRVNRTEDLVHEATMDGYIETIERVGEDSYVGVGTTAETGDVLVAWIRDDGTVEWTETYGGDGVEIATDVVSAPDGDAYVLAATESFGVETSDLWVLRLDRSGDVVWERRVEHEKWTAFPSGARLSDGSLIATIRTERSMDKEVDGQQNVSVSRIAPDGSIEWRTVVTGTGEPFDKEEMFDVVPAHGDGVVLAGASNSGNDDLTFDYWAARVGSDGDLHWQQQYETNGDGFANAIVRTREGYLLGGFTRRGDANMRAVFVAIDGEGNERMHADYSRLNFTDEQLGAMDWTTGGRLLAGGISASDRSGELNSVPWVSGFTDAFPQLRPGPSPWATQHGGQTQDESGTGGDGTDQVGGDGAVETNDSVTPGDVAPGSEPTMELALYGAATVSIILLFVPYGVRRFRRR